MQSYLNFSSTLWPAGYKLRGRRDLFRKAITARLIDQIPGKDDWVLFVQPAVNCIPAARRKRHSCNMERVLHLTTHSYCPIILNASRPHRILGNIALPSRLCVSKAADQMQWPKQECSLSGSSVNNKLEGSCRCPKLRQQGVG